MDEVIRQYCVLQVKQLARAFQIIHTTVLKKIKSEKLCVFKIDLIQNFVDDGDNCPMSQKMLIKPPASIFYKKIFSYSFDAKAQEESLDMVFPG